MLDYTGGNKKGSSDPADAATDKILKNIENQITKEYAQAEKEIKQKLDDYLRRFQVKDELKRKALANGLISEDEYKQWRIGQIMMGKRWEEMRDSIAKDLTNADQIARSIAFGHMPEVYAINHDYGTFQIEAASLLDTSYTLYDRQAMEQLMKDNDQTFIPAPGRKVTQAINEGKAMAWNRKQVQSAMMQSLLQGESIPDIATRLAKTVGESDRKAAIRNARTMTTGIENAGRMASYKRANDMGIETQKQWLATLDSRTRHWHSSLDGVKVDNDKPFTNEYGDIMYPGDPAADPSNIFNCRCTLIASIKGFERDVSDMGLRHDDNLGDMTYDEWRAGKYDQISDPITKQDDIAEIMKRKYGEEYAALNNLSNNNDSDLKYSAASVNIDIGEINVPRSEEIDSFIDSQQIHDRFPNIIFEESFDVADLEIQKEIAQGLDFMKGLFGDQALPQKLAVAKMSDYGTCSLSGRICIKSGMQPGLTLLTTCHECVHRLDNINGDIAEDIMRAAYKSIKVRFGTNAADKILVDSIGPGAYIKYGKRKDKLNRKLHPRYDEQMAWSFESSLHDKNDLLGSAVFEELKRRFGDNG